MDTVEPPVTLPVPRLPEPAPRRFRARLHARRMTYLGVPEVATPHMMARTLAIFYVAGGSVGLLAAWASDGAVVHRLVVCGLGTSAVLVGLVLARWGTSFPRSWFHVAVALASAMVTIAVLVSPDEVSALLISLIMVFIAMDTFFFFPVVAGGVQLVVGVGLVVTALLVRPDLALGHVIGAALIIVAVSVVTYSLAQWASQASRDPLTGLRNRRGFDAAMLELVREADRTGHPLSAALLDLDHFKLINDTGGHDAGDLTLCRMADQWTTALPSSAVLARHGGDEFALILPGLDGEQTLSLLRTLAVDLPDPALSIGVAEHVRHDGTAALMRRADAALYAAKTSGRGRCELLDAS